MSTSRSIIPEASTPTKQENSATTSTPIVANVSNAPLRKVADIQLFGTIFAIGKNGHYYLVDESSVDAWGKSIGKIVEPQHLAAGPDLVCLALLDALGEAVEKIKAMEMGRERRMGAATEKGQE